MNEQDKLKEEIELDLRKELAQDLAEADDSGPGFGARAKKAYNKLSDVELYAHSIWMTIFFIFCLIFTILDVYSWYSPIGVWMEVRFLFWSMFSLLVWAVMSFVTSEKTQHGVAAFFCLKNAAYTIIPVYLLLGVDWFADLVIGFIPQLASISHILFTGVTSGAILFAYLYSGWPHFFFKGESRKTGPLGSLGGFFYGLTAVFLILIVFTPPIMVTWAWMSDNTDSLAYNTPLKDQIEEFQRVTGLNIPGGGEPEPVDGGDPDDVDETPCNWWPVSDWKNCIDDLQNRVNPVPETEYTSRVDQYANSGLGVYIKNQEALRDPYRYIEQDDRLIADPAAGYNTFDWNGEVASSIVANSMNVDLFCEYHYLNEDREKSIVPDEASLTATPETIRVLYSPQGAEDISFFTCSMPASTVLETGNAEGRFMTRAVYDFETWGYATISFIGQEEYVAITAQGRQPADVLGIDRTLVARYTPGPVRLGMFDRLTLPRPVDLNTSGINNWPNFGVTLTNAWTRGTGRVSSVAHLIFQVPEPFELDTVNCLGTDSLPVLDNSNSDYPRIAGYNFYTMRDIEFGDDVRQRTFTCPVKLMNGKEPADVLGPNLNAKQHTFVALAKYTFEQEAPLNVRLTQTRTPQ